MMQALRRDGIKLVLVESLGCLARDLVVQESILHDVRRHGFQLISSAEPDLCSDDPSRKPMRQILGAFHEYEKAMIAVSSVALVSADGLRTKTIHTAYSGEEMSRYFKIRILFALLTFQLMVGCVAEVWSPYSILSTHPGRSLSELVPLTLAGALLIGAGVFGYLWCALDFAFTGLLFALPCLWNGAFADS
jgi:hypothetical protein